MTVMAQPAGQDGILLNPHATLDGPASGRHDVATVESGMIMLAATLPDGRRQALGFYLPGESFCTGSTPIDGYSLQLTAVTTTRIRLADMPAAGPIAHAEQLHAIACRQARGAADHVIMLGKLDALERIAHFLLDMACRQHGYVATNCLVELPMTREEIGDYLGLNALTVTRCLSKLRAQAVLSLPEPHSVFLQDIQRLRGLSPMPAQGR